MNRFIVDTRGLTAFGGSRPRKLLWTLTTFERPYIWLLPVATSLLIYWAPADALTQDLFLGRFCRWLIAAVSGLRFEPSTSPFPEVVQIAVCLGFTMFWAHLALAIVYFWAKPVTTAAGIQRMHEAGRSVSKGLVAGVAFTALSIAGIWAILTSGNDPNVYVRSQLSSRLQLAFLFGLGPFVWALGMVALVAISISLLKQKSLRQE